MAKKGQIKSILNLERALRNGVRPRDIIGVEEIGRGAQNIAYKWQGNTTSYVIKTIVGGWNDGKKRPPAEISQFGARFARTYKAGNYMIQELVVSTINDLPMSHPARQEHMRMFSGIKCAHDMHAKNCGIDSNGQVVVFDW